MLGQGATGQGSRPSGVKRAMGRRRRSFGWFRQSSTGFHYAAVRSGCMCGCVPGGGTRLHSGYMRDFFSAVRMRVDRRVDRRGR